MVKKKTVRKLTERAKALRAAKDIRQRMLKEARKYERAKVKGRTKEFYKRAAEILRQEASGYTQAAVKVALRKGETSYQELSTKEIFQKTFSRGKWAENVARRILSTREGEPQTTQAGARFYAGLISIWDTGGTEAERSKAYKMRDQRILDAFGAKNLLQVMERIESELGINLMDMLQNPEKYDEAVNAIQAYVSQNVR